ncbi:MAG: hypothetical protein J6C53_03440 [Clostridia bacterium]|nr:hypothetical protein [Clostridia bacterium]
MINKKHRHGLSTHGDAFFISPPKAFPLGKVPAGTDKVEDLENLNDNRPA